MPRTSDMIPSKFLKQSDIGEGKLVTIRNLTKENVARDDAEPEYKWTIHFDELDKPLVLNTTNIGILEAILQSDNSDDWTGKQVVLYVDPTVNFGGKVVGGIRVRAKKGQEPVSDLPF